MLPTKTRHLVYAVLLLAFSIVCTSAIANTSVYKLLSEVISEKETPESALSLDGISSVATVTSDKMGNSRASSPMSPMFMTIIQGADEEVGCANDGSTIARFNLCGDFDNRVVSLAGSFSSVSWQILGGGCSPDVNDDCPNTNASCYTQVATGPTFTIDASTISSASGAEYRVIADGQQYFFKVKKSNITQTFVKEDAICGVPGRIQITNLSSAYEFSIDSGSGFGPWQGPIFDNLAPGTYIVKARLQGTPDACEYPYEPITIDQQDMDIDVTFTDALCVGDTGTITVTPTPGIGPYRYTLLDASGVAQEFTAFVGDNPYTFNAVGFGTYTVQVETQQCTGDPLNGIDPPRQSLDTSGNPIIIGSGVSALDARAEPNNSFSAACGISSVDITVYTSGGTAPYTYIVNGVGPSSPSYTDSRVETVTSPGTYDFLITDANGCTITASANIEELTPPDITVAGVDGTCTNGGARLEFTITDPKGYDLSFRADTADPWSTNPVLSVTAGTYNNIEVLYESGAFSCILPMPGSVTVNEVGAISGAAVKLSDRTCILGGGVNGGQIEFQGPFTGGSGTGYQFSIDGVNFSTTTLYTGLGTGTYNPAIIDDSGCRRDLTAITINDVDPPTDIAFAQSNINCAAGTSDVQLTATSANAIATYEVVSPVTQSNATGLFTGLATGVTHEFRITDVNNCSYTETFTPVQTSSIRARVRSGGDLRVCTGASDGSGTFIIDGFANTYTYDINGGLFTGGPQSDLEVVLPPSGAGTYTITVTDTDTGCTDTASFDIEEPTAPVSLTGNVTDMSCANGNVGRVIGDATDGWGGYLYTLTYPGGGTVVGPRTSRTFNNLSLPGTYELSVVDAEGCTDTFNFTLTQIDAPTIALDAGATDYCYVPGTGATVGVTSTAGSAAAATHQYRINGGSLQASPLFTGLTPGNYTIEVVDGNNCRDQVNVTIRPQLRVNTSIDTEIPCGGAPGQIRVQVSGGYLANATPKEYQVSADNGVTYGAAQPLTANSFLYPVTAGGTYMFRVTDNEGCEAFSSPLTVDPPVQIAPATVDITPVSCGSTNNGRVTITPDATSGIPPYEVSFNGGPFTSQTVYSNLPVGTYPFVVRDARGCETPPADAVVTLDPTASPDTSVAPTLATCNAGSIVSGGIDINGVTGGSPNFTFIVEDSSGTEIVRADNVDPSSLPISLSNPGLVPGTYTVITLDANGCRDVDVVDIIQTELDVVPDPVTPVCSVTGFSNTVEIVGGTGPFLIRLADDPSPPVTPNIPPRRHTFNGLQFGVTYTVEVTDLGTGCIYFEEIPPVDGPSPLDVNATSTAGFCDVNRNGEIVYEVSGFTLGDNLQIEIVNNDDGTRTVIETVTPGSIPYSNSYLTLPGDYQIIVTNLTDSCTDASGIVVDQNLPSIDILAEEPANCNAAGQITVQGAGGAGGPYEFAYMTSGGIPATTDWTTDTTFIGPADTYDVYVRDISGCTSFAIATIIQLDPDLVAPGITVDNQCVVTATAFDITVTMPASTDTPRFTLAGETQFAVFNGVTNLWEYTFQVSSPGTYTVDVVDANGCTSTGTAEVYEFLTASGDFSSMPTCNSADGVITLEVIGGSDQFSYQLQDSGGTDIGTAITGDRNDGIISGVAPGDYLVEVTDTETGCDFTVPVSLVVAIPPVIDNEIDQDISCFGVNDGSIDILLRSGTDVDVPIEFILNDLTAGGAEVTRNNTGSFIGLTPATYQVEVLTARGCSTLSNPIVISQPLDFQITASAPDFACEPGANRFSSTTITVGIVSGSEGTPGPIAGQEYQYSITGFDNYQYANTFEIVDNGSPQNITVYAIDANGCQTTFAVPTINPPTDVVPSLTVLDALNCRDPEQVEISAVGTNNYTIITTAPGSTVVADVNGTNATPAVVSLPVEGDYFFVLRDNVGGCDYPLPVHTVVSPIDPTVTISEAQPVRCAVPGNNGALFIEVTDYVGVYSYTVYEASDAGKTTPITTGSFDTNNFPDVSGDPARITGLPGGSYFVEVTSSAVPFCSGDSGVATIRVPNGELDVQTVEIGNVTCDDNAGVIEATGSGGWDTSAYEYRLLRDDGSGYVEIVPFDVNNRFENLPSGNYRVEVRDVEGCTDTADRILDSIPPIDAGIREPSGLVCPGGNNAVLEAFDPITGNPGASGGVTGAGYKFQLIYLNSNDILDERDRSGLQDSPTFIGTSGGVISAGWYAIEVTSSFNCSFVTPPYEVIPPPPVDPRLVQTQVPGCGGAGEMEIRIENAEPTATYEYQIIENGTPIGSLQPLPSNPFRFPGFGGITYQVDIQKTSGGNICPSVRSNGITMTDATGIALAANTPDDISCFSELDGRIESFAVGGVGNEMYTLYVGDPVDAFAPVTPRYDNRPAQSFGTFEGLEPRTDYYIGVTSGLNCQDIAGPFEIIRPAEIEFVTTETPVTCNGDADGTITVEVTAGGEGLIQFAIGPNFNEFFSDPATPGLYTFEELEGNTTYEILIQDANGCFERVDVTINEPDELLITNVNVTPELCIGANDGTMNFGVSGGTPIVDPLVSPAPYFEFKVEMIDPIDETGTGVFAPYIGQTIQNLQGGASYAIYIQDANGCTDTEVFTVGIGVDLTAEPLVEYGCEGIFPNSTASVQMQDTGLLPELLFYLEDMNSLDPPLTESEMINQAETTLTWGDLPASDYTVHIFHSNGCSNTVTFTMESYEPLTLTAEKTGPNEVTAIASGGYGGYEYFFQGESQGTDNIFLSNQDALVQVRVVDARGCVATAAVEFIFTGKLEIPNFFTPDNDGMNDEWEIGNREFFPSIEVKIYDRYGRVVAILDQVTNWDGTYEGKELPSGDYWYVVNQNDDRDTRFVGHFTLYR